MRQARYNPEEQARRRFRAEAEALARLRHPNIVQVYDFGEQNGLLYLVMEFMEGGNLAQQIREQSWAARPAAQLVQTLARAVHHTHQQGIIHRDLKPANVLLTAEGTPKISDFGLTKRLENPLEEDEGLILGTPSYMAPEQAAGKVGEIGPATDVYCLGAMLFELLTARPPFKAATLLDTLEQVRTQDPVPPRRLQPKVPGDLEAICLKCLRKDPGQRYASAQTLAEDLERFLAGRPVEALPVGVGGRLYRWCCRLLPGTR
jgi:serine/threonine protein kinase